LIEEIGLFHPMLDTQMPQKDSIANAFDWTPHMQSIEAKYGDGVNDLRRLYEEVAPTLEAAQRLRTTAANS
jgi:chromosome partitioning protein